MTFQHFSAYLQKLESTTKRLEITSILTQLIKDLPANQIDKAVYLSLGYLKAPYENPDFNIAEKMMARILAYAYDKDQKEVAALYSKLGDLGDTADKLSNKKSSTITIEDVYQGLLDTAKIGGSGSQELKVKKMTELLQKLDKLSAKYVTRIVLGTTRLGFSELTVIDALSEFACGNKSSSDTIEQIYNIHPDIGLISRKIKVRGITGINDINVEVGVPILSQKCQRLPGVEDIVVKMGRVWAEYKFDGMRVQLHMDKKKEALTNAEEQNTIFDSDSKKVFIKTFTRNQDETTHQFPDLIDAALKQISADSVIIDGEAIGYDKKTGEFLPLQQTMQRKRKHDIELALQNVPLKYFVFDLLYLNGKALLDKPLSERHDLLKKITKDNGQIEVAYHISTDNEKDLGEFFESAKEKNLEGIIVKKPEIGYQAGARSFAWVKLKKADTKFLTDTVDCVVLGYSYGKGVRAKFGIGQFLVGVYDPKTDGYKTVSKVGTGLKDEDFIYLKKEADKLKIKEKPVNVEVTKRFIPDVWVTPKIVVELGADEISKSPDHSAGYALRFPRLIKFRADKNPNDATSVEEIVTLYKSQKRGYYSIS